MDGRLERRLIARWTHARLRCGIAWGSIAGCGYVQLPEGHPDLGRPYDEVDVDVHGGLTYGDEYGWLGFDTAHGFDEWPREAAEALLTRIADPEEQARARAAWASWQQYAPSGDLWPRHPWDEARLRREVESLAEQLYARAVRGRADGLAAFLLPRRDTP